MPATPASAPALPQARGVRATWWYTLTALVFFELVVAGLWALDQLERGMADPAPIAAFILGALWCTATVVLMMEYRHRTSEDAPVSSRVGWIVLAATVVVAGCALPLGGGPTIAVVMLAQAVILLNWRRGLRWKVLLAATLLIVAVAWATGTFAGAELAPGARFVAIYSALLPAMTVASLWWWDVLITLDRARASEVRLAATQERLRLATDVHDLQGHHLQVIALQLELAARLMPRDAVAGMEQLALARASVDDARQGTRDLATRFRSVPLRDELANAQDLLRAAGHQAEAVCVGGVENAPADVLGPVIRETTTNILRHGRSGDARLSLTRDGEVWVYEAANDADEAAASGAEHGSGLDGIAGRVAAVGGTVDTRREGGRFTVIVRVPAQGQTA